MNHSTINLSELASRESATVEWKENVADIKDIIRTLVAFANDFLNLGGGYVVCGAKEGKDLHGFQAVKYVGLTSTRLKEIKETVVNNCTNSTRVNPPLNPKIDEIDVPNDPERKILIFTIDASNNAHTYKSDSKEISRYFIRTDYSTKEATNGFIRELLRRKGQIEPWDMRLEPKSSQLDIDQIVLRQYLQDMKLWRSDKSIDEYLSDTEKIEQFIPPLMGKIGFDKPACPKNFTLMVFGKDLLKFCECAYTIFAIYEGSDKSKPRSDTQWIAGTVVEQAKKIIELLNVESSSIAIDKERDSVNQFKYPAIALKEAVVNAIVHRDYEVNRPVRIEVYSNRIEIHSPGRLPFNIDVEKFRKGTATASWRNRSFARIFTRLDLAQSQGSGISRIIASMQEEGCPPPIFELGEEDVTCIVPAHPRHEIMRLLSEAESDIVVKDYINAYSKLEKVLSKDVYNYRALELFCELSILTGNVMNILHILIQDDIDFRKIRPNTLITLSDTLSTLKNSESASNISKQLLDIALTGRLEETQLIKGVITLRKLGENKKTVELIDEIFRYHSNLSNNSDLHDQKARSLIDLAKVCQDTFYSSTNSTLKERAKTDFKRYIEQAEKNLRIAYDNSESSISKDWIKNSMDYLENQMKPFLTGQESSWSVRRLYVTNIPKLGGDKTMEVLNQYGKIAKTIAIRPDNNNSDKLFAYIECETKKDADNIYENRYKVYIDGVKLKINRFEYRKNKHK